MAFQRLRRVQSTVGLGSGNPTAADDADWRYHAEPVTRVCPGDVAPPAFTDGVLARISQRLGQSTRQPIVEVIAADDPRHPDYVAANWAGAHAEQRMWAERRAAYEQRSQAWGETTLTHWWKCQSWEDVAGHPEYAAQAAAVAAERKAKKAAAQKAYRASRKAAGNNVTCEDGTPEPMAQQRPVAADAQPAYRAPHCGMDGAARE